MNWASRAIEILETGQSAYVHPRGNSMTGRVENGQRVNIDPTVEPEVDNVVLVRCNGNVYLHLVKAQKGNQFLIGNNKNKLNGWVHRKAIYGVAVDV